MPRGKKNSDAKTTSKPEKVVAVSDEPIKEKVAEPEKESVQKKKATVPKKSATKTGATKKSSTSSPAKAESAKTAPIMETKTKESTAAKTKTSAASTAKKTAKSKSDEVVFQSGDKDYTLSAITEVCKNAYRGGTRKQIKSIKVYVKAENNQLKAYYVVNDDISGSVDL